MSGSLSLVSDKAESAKIEIESFKDTLSSFDFDVDRTFLFSLGELFGRADEEEAKQYIEKFKESIKESLTNLNVDISNGWVDELSEQVKSGEISATEFFTKVEEKANSYGVKLDDISRKQSAISSMQFNFSESVGTDEEFKKIIDTVDELYSMKKTLANGDFLDYEDFRELTDNFSDLADIIDEYDDISKLTADDVQDIIDELTNKTEEDLEEIEKLFEDTFDNIDKIVDKAKFGTDFSDKMDTAFDDASEALEKGEDLSFIDPDVVSDEGALTDYAEQIQSVSDALENMSMSAENAQGQLYMLGLEALNGQAQADAFGLIVDLLGGDFENLDTDVQQALIDLGLYNAETGMADSTQMVATLQNIGNNFDNADAKTQEAYTSLMNYIAAIGEAENAAPKSGELSGLIAGSLGEIKAAANVGRRESRVRQSGLNNANKSGAKKASGGSGSGKKGGGSGSGNNYSAEDAADDLKKILNDIEKYERDIEADLEDQTEELLNHYNLEKNKLETIKEELEYYEDIYDEAENTTKWLTTQNKLLTNQSKTVAELQKSTDKIEKQRAKIYSENSKYNVASWFDSELNETLAYGDLLNSFEYQIEAIQKETAQKMRNVYNSVSGSTNKDAISDAKEKIKNIEDEADIRIKAIEKEKKKVENIYDSVEQLNDAWKDNREAIRDALSEMHDRLKDIRDTLTDQLMEQLEKAVDRQNSSIEKDATRMEQLVDIREKYYDILNETLDTQQELDKELQSSLDSFEYLDEQMRQLMFNEDDYKVLSNTLEGIQDDIANIWENHYQQIDELTDDTMYKAEYITAETERQLDMKMQEYELAKAELDVAKARTNLENVKNERNVRMFVGGQWVWTADPNAVKSAQEQLADAEREKNRIEREAEQKRLIDSMNRIVDSDNLQIDENNELLERVQEAIEEQTVEVKSVEEALQNITNENLPMMGDILHGAFGSDGKSGWISELLTNINKSTAGLTLALKGYTVSSAEQALKNGSLSKGDFNDLVSRLGYSFNETTGLVTTPEGTFSAHYKGWTRQSNNDIQLTTAANGVQVTGGSSSGGGDAGGGSSGATGFPRQGTVSTSSSPLRIRSGAGTNYKILGTMPKGAAVTITGEENSGWAKVSYNGINGYASRQYLTYDQGGLAYGKGMLFKDVVTPERILSPKQTKSFDNLVNNLTTNPVLQALTKNVKGTSNINGLMGGMSNVKKYYFSNFTVKADNLTEFVDSLEGMIPISNK